MRSLADSAFLRVYVLLGGVLLLMMSLVVAGRLLVGKVHEEYRRDQRLQVPMRLMTERLAGLPEAAWPARLALWSNELGMALSLTPLEELELGYFAHTRLSRGGMTVEEMGEGGWRLRQRLPESDQVLVGRLARLDGRFLEGVAHLAAVGLSGLPPEERAAWLHEQDTLAMPLRLHDRLPEMLEAHHVEHLARGRVVLWVDAEHFRPSAFLALPDVETTWLQVGPLERFDELPFPLHLMLLISLTLLLVMSMFLIMRRVETRMARLELAATRIASGRLDTRVKVESGDFLGRLGMAFNGMAAQVQSLLRAQQDMIRAVSHELRTPVARIRFAAQMVEDMTDDPVIRRQLEGIDGDINELDGLIDEILTYARLGNEAINGREMGASLIDCRAMAKRVIETLRPLHGHLHLELAEGPEVEALAEPRYLQRALQNLVANACRHASRRVVIRLQGEPHLVRLDVEDDGPGVPASERQAIFKPFARLDDSRTRSSGGYGLGLSIVQKVMTWHGGSVAVDESPELGGARFTLLLPQGPAVRETIQGGE